MFRAVFSFSIPEKNKDGAERMLAQAFLFSIVGLQHKSSIIVIILQTCVMGQIPGDKMDEVLHTHADEEKENQTAAAAASCVFTLKG